MQNHLLIAGTGRAGTSFLLEYLTELGLDTHLSRHDAHACRNEDIPVGVEDMPLVGDISTWPYVVASSCAYQLIDKLLERDDIRIDGVIILIRDLIAMANSHSLTETQDLDRAAPRLPELDQTWEQWALAPGGMVYSLNALDQARLLAVGFHHLVERLVKADTRISFVHVPEMFADPDDLYRQLAGFLPEGVTIDRAREAHARAVDSGNVRVSADLKADVRPDRSDARPVALAPTVKYPSLADNDAIAQRRETRRLRADMRRLADSVEQSRTALSAKVSQGRSDLGRLTEELTRRSEQVCAAETALAATRQTMDEGQRQVAELEAQIAHAQQQLAQIDDSVSWRVPKRLRALNNIIRAKSRRRAPN